MSLYGSFLSDEQFQCSICLDVFINPSSTPCGHSFCMSCISRYWDAAKVCQCPLCKKTFQKRPELQINRTLREITEQFRSMTGGGGGVAGGRGGVTEKKKEGRAGGAGGGDVVIPAHFFHELKKKLPRHPTSATSSDCNRSQEDDTLPASLASSVPNSSPIAAAMIGHAPTLPPPPPGPTRSSGRRRFTVSGAASSQSLAICEVHNRGLMIYCRTDRSCICPECELEQHQDHDTVSVTDEWKETQSKLSVSEQEVQELIKLRMRRIEEIRKSVSELEILVEQETAGSVCLFSALVTAVQRSQSALMESMEMSRRSAEHRADAEIKRLEQEVEELRKREKVLVQLRSTEDHVQCVQSFATLSPPLHPPAPTTLTFDLGTSTIYRSLLVEMEKFQEELKTVAEKGFPASVLEPSPVRTQPRVRSVQEYAVDISLDEDTAHPRLVLSEDRKSVRCGDRHQLLPDNPERFDRVVCVLGREAISSGRHYWEVEVGGKTDWDLGVAKQSINRKGKIEVNPMNGYWFLSLRNKNKYAFRTEPSTDVHLNLRPQKIGIFVDFDKGQVSFYNVEAKLHIYSFHDSFSENIFPFFSPCTNKSGKNDAPLAISPVSRSQSHL